MLNQEEHERLVAIQDELNSLLKEAERLVRKGGTENQLAMARETWLKPAMNAVNPDGNPGTMGHNMSYTIDELEPYEDD